MNSADDHRFSVRERIFAWLQLVRLPNAFTALADVMMGFLVTHGNLQHAGEFATLCCTSLSFYWAGMVLNDVYDVEIDRRERPERPIPSGRISLATARFVGYVLLFNGLLLTAW